MERTIIKTSDGSHSIHVKELNENYHSLHGAIQESKHVFIDAGLKASSLPLSKGKEFYDILEIGLGTGLNAFLTYVENLNSKRNIYYTALEAFPLEETIINELNYVELLNAKEHTSVFDKIHHSKWEQTIELNENFTLLKIKNTLQAVILENKKFDLIYFDAFGPPTQPELWTETIFSKIVEATKQSGILVTYCAKGEVKRTLKKVGFMVESLPGPTGKREMVRATKL